jgi:2-dehydropantoate 2-reductase
MKIMVVGAGAVGSWLGGTLWSAGAEVTLVERAPYAATIRERGVRIEGRQPIAARPAVISSVAEAIASANESGTPYDVAFLTVKSYDAASVGSELAAVGAPPRVVCCQNGVGVERELEQLIADSCIVPATLTLAVHVEEPGSVVAWHKGGVGLASPRGGPDSSDIASLFRSAGLETRLYEDGAAMKWSKLLLNMIGAPTSAALGWPPPRILRHRQLFEVERAAWLEAVAAIRRLGHEVVQLPDYRVDMFSRWARFVPAGVLFRFVHRTVGRERGDRLPGVTLDMIAGRHATEITYLNGAVAAAGRSTGEPAPVNAALCGLVEDMVSGQLDRSAFVDRPDRVMQELSQRGVVL